MEIPKDCSLARGRGNPRRIIAGQAGSESGSTRCGLPRRAIRRNSGWLGCFLPLAAGRTAFAGCFMALPSVKSWRGRRVESAFAPSLRRMKRWPVVPQESIKLRPGPAGSGTCRNQGPRAQKRLTRCFERLQLICRLDVTGCRQVRLLFAGGSRFQAIPGWKELPLPRIEVC